MVTRLPPPLQQEEYLAFSRPCLLSQESSVYAPAAGVLTAAGSAAVQRYQAPAREPGKQPVYELRQYQVVIGGAGSIVLAKLCLAAPAPVHGSPACSRVTLCSRTQTR